MLHHFVLRRISWILHGRVLAFVSVGARRGGRPQEWAEGGDQRWGPRRSRGNATLSRAQDQVVGVHDRQGGVPTGHGQQHRRGCGRWRFLRAGKLWLYCIFVFLGRGEGAGEIVPCLTVAGESMRFYFTIILVQPYLILMSRERGWGWNRCLFGGGWVPSAIRKTIKIVWS